MHNISFPLAASKLAASNSPTVEAPSQTMLTESPSYHGLLFDRAIDDVELDHCAEPGYFPDLNLDQLAASVISHREEYNLLPYLYRRLDSVAAIDYRHDVFRDLEQAAVRQALTDFGRGMNDMRSRREQAAKLHYRLQTESWILGAIRVYAHTVERLLKDLSDKDLASHALVSLRNYLNFYVSSPEFATMKASMAGVSEGLSKITYLVHLHGSRVTVSVDTGEADYSSQVQQIFERFRQHDETQDHHTKFDDYVEMNHVEAQILDQVARLFPSEFADLRTFTNRYKEFADELVLRTDRESQFYLAWLEYMDRIRTTGLSFCYPEVSPAKTVRVQDCFDAALADGLADSGRVVCNDFELHGSERIFVVTGPNQGGKTTFARTFGQLHHLASIGCLVPGSAAELFLCDQIFTHFEAVEDLSNLSGKLENDLQRIQEILQEATGNSIIILNEAFSSTTLKDARILGARLIEEITTLGALAVYVTFIDELSALNSATVSMASTVSSDDPTERTFKVIRKRADGLAFALSLAEKHGLAYQQLRKRFTP